MFDAIFGRSVKILKILAKVQCVLGNEARMNAPSTVGRNWRWRIGKDTLSEERRAWIRTLAAVYRR